MKAIILAAGYATRLNKLGVNTPKALLPVGDKQAIDYLLDRLNTVSKLTDVILVSNDRFFEQFEQWKQNSIITRTWVFDELHLVNDGTTDSENRLGAIGDLNYVINSYSFDDDVIIVSSDNIFPFDFIELVEYFEQVGSDVVPIYTPKIKQRLQRTGVVEIDKTNQIIGFEEKPAKPRSDFASPTSYVFRQDTLSMVGDYLQQENDPDAPGNFISWLYQQLPVYAWWFSGEPLDIGTPQSYEAAHQILKQA